MTTSSRDDSSVYKLDRNMAPLQGSDVPLLWHDPSEMPFRLSGFPWFAEDGVYRRLPVHPTDPLPEAVDNLANCTAGGQIAFRTTSSRIAIQVRLTGRAGMAHMPSTGQCGFDLYLGLPCQERFVNASKYDHSQTSYELQLFSTRDSGTHDAVLYFPLYMGVEEVLVGLDPDAEVLAPAPRSLKGPVVVYGTSITQGGCAARPGMAYTNLLSRWLNLEVVNLGFSGNGRGEPEVARTIAQIPDPLMHILDYEANSNEGIRDTLPGCIRILRDANPRVPIMVLSRIRYTSELNSEEALQKVTDRREFQRETVQALRDAGDTNVHFLDGPTLLGDDFHECTVDGSHPTDLGFWRMAKGIEPIMRRILFDPDSWR